MPVFPFSYLRKIWRHYETASPDVIKRERRQERNLVKLFMFSFGIRSGSRRFNTLYTFHCLYADYVILLGFIGEKHILKNSMSLLSKKLIFLIWSFPVEYEISAPLQRNSFWGTSVTLECAVYESTPRATAQPPPVAQVIQRGSWKTGSTSSTSSESKCLSLLSAFIKY